eukprot:TRINITY_DN10635_c0_g1_i1.p1 TRINITY_DN10635_c0_g1~~TRINITY_DN10635_c0_g1_i1.p1  ORF type:complete len:552 (-),score=106.76 TRINITY_DN10635_c0_g1_i1:120-1775(-)
MERLSALVELIDSDPVIDENDPNYIKQIQDLLNHVTNNEHQTQDPYMDQTMDPQDFSGTRTPYVAHGSPSTVLADHPDVQNYNDLIVVSLKQQFENTLKIYPDISPNATPDDQLRHLSAKKNALTGLKRQIDDCLNRFIIPDVDLRKHLELRQEVLEEVVFTKLKMNEINLVWFGQILPTLKLLIRRQPFPKCIKQNQALITQNEEALEVILIKSPHTVINTSGVLWVTAHLSYDSSSMKKREVTFTNEKAKLRLTLENENIYRADFQNIKFTKGSGKRLLNLYFRTELEVQIHGQVSGLVTVESKPSRPFCVITNENQWSDSTGPLLERELFYTKPTHGAPKLTEISLVRFINIFQYAFIRATKQEPFRAKENRSLSNEDLNYLFTLANGATFGERGFVINPKEFEKIWKIAGLVFMKLRHHKPYLSLWTSRLLYGFSSKLVCSNVFSSGLFPPGSCVLRFSDRNSGDLAIALFVRQGENARHFLIVPDTADRSIAEMLMGNDLFKHIVSYDPDGCGYKIIEKKEALVNQLEHRKPKTSNRITEGYEILV